MMAMVMVMGVAKDSWRFFCGKGDWKRRGSAKTQFS